MDSLWTEIVTFIIDVFYRKNVNYLFFIQHWASCTRLLIRSFYKAKLMEYCPNLNKFQVHFYHNQVFIYLWLIQSCSNMTEIIKTWKKKIMENTLLMIAFKFLWLWRKTPKKNRKLTIFYSNFVKLYHSINNIILQDLIDGCKEYWPNLNQF